LLITAEKEAKRIKKEQDEEDNKQFKASRTPSRTFTTPNKMRTIVTSPRAQVSRSRASSEEATAAAALARAQVLPFIKLCVLTDMHA
jgi:hypothetical protein